MSKNEKFQTGVTDFFSGLGKAISNLNDGEEWLSGTFNITADPQGEAPIITSIILPGTSKGHAKKIQSGLGDFFKGLE